MHVGMPMTAELGTLAAINTGTLRHDSDHIHMSRDGVYLAGQSWQPEAVDHIAACDAHIDGLIRWNHQHRRGLCRSARVVEFPSVLVCDGIDRQHSRVVACNEALAAHKRESDKGQERDQRKDETASDDPLPLADILRTVCSPEGIDQQGGDESEDRGCAQQHDPPELRDDGGRGARRIKGRERPGAAA